MRILIADNQSKVRFALSVLLQEQQGWIIIGNAVNAGDVLAKVISLKPDVLLLDWDLPGLHHADLLGAVRRLSDSILIISISANPEVRQEVLTLGADFFVSKIDSPQLLIEIFRDCETRSLKGLPPTPDNKVLNKLDR